MRFVDFGNIYQHSLSRATSSEVVFGVTIEAKLAADRDRPNLDPKELGAGSMWRPTMSSFAQHAGSIDGVCDGPDGSAVEWMRLSGKKAVLERGEKSPDAPKQLAGEWLE